MSIPPHGGKELARSGSRTFVVVATEGIEIGEAPPAAGAFAVCTTGRTPEQTVAQVLEYIAGAANNG